MPCEAPVRPSSSALFNRFRIFILCSLSSLRLSNQYSYDSTRATLMKPLSDPSAGLWVHWRQVRGAGITMVLWCQEFRVMETTRNTDHISLTLAFRTPLPSQRSRVGTSC